MGSRPERVAGHTGTETRPRLLREAAVGNTAQTPTGGSSGEFCAMLERVTQRRRVNDEGLRVVKFFRQGRMCVVVTDYAVTVPV